jgi:two-component system, cell cycle sensor histidine kinase and response regulator CckA
MFDMLLQRLREYMLKNRLFCPQTAAETIAASDAAPPPVSQNGIETVLVVEDEDIVRRVVTRALRKRGYQVLEGKNADEALELARDPRVLIDLLLTDVMMPGLNGRQLAKQLTAQRPDMAVLYMSGHDEDIVSKHGVLEPGIAFIPKTFSPGSLSQKVREVLDAHSRLRALRTPPLAS